MRIERRPDLPLALAASAFCLLALAGVLWASAEAEHRRLSEQTHACLSNVKRVAVALRVYAGDHDDRLPLGLDVAGDEFDSFSSPVRESWPAALLPYTAPASELGAHAVYRCPAVARRYGDLGVTYAVSTGTLEHSDPATGEMTSWPLTVQGYRADAGRRLADCPDPAGTILAYEIDAPTLCGTHGTRLIDDEAGTLGSGIAPMHGRGGNYAYIDGRAAWWWGGKPSASWHHGWAKPRASTSGGTSKGGGGDASGADE
jgi:prepilin-type processing-associated H-X9-DG protein